MPERAEKIVAAAVSGDRPVLHVVAPELAPAARHGLAGRIVAALEPHSEADPAALLLSVLAGFGALVGPGPHALADGAEHAPVVWPLIVGDTAKARKGSSWAQVRRVIGAADRRFVDERILGGFGSGEALVDAVATADDRRLLVVEPEYARILSVSKREGSTLAALLRQAWDGGRLQVRSRAGVSVADGAHVVVIGHVTRDELLAKLAESDAAGGSLNRFVVVAARRSKLLPSGGNLDDQTVAALGRLLADAATQARRLGIVRRTVAAEAYWAELYGRLADDEPGGLLGAVIARDSAQLLRLSVLYALLDCAAQVDVDHIVAAEAVWAYARSSAAVIFGQQTGNVIADRILAELQRRGRDGMDGTAVRDLFGRHATKEQITAARKLLEAKGLVSLERVATGGRPATVLVATQGAPDLSSQGRFCRNATTEPEAAQTCDISDKSSLPGRRDESSAGPSLTATCDQSDVSDQRSAVTDEDIDRWAAEEES